LKFKLSAKASVLGSLG